MSLIQGHLLLVEPVQICTDCGVPLTLLHTLVECSHEEEYCIFNLHGMLEVISATCLILWHALMV
jgi:hypothetical protein